MSKSRSSFAFLLFVPAVMITCSIPIFASENTDSRQEPENLLWLLVDQYLKEPQPKGALSPQYEQILHELADSKVPTIAAAKHLVEEDIKSSDCLAKDIDSLRTSRTRMISADFHSDSIKVTGLARCLANIYLPYLAKKGDLIWTVKADRLQTSTGSPSSKVFAVNATTGEVTIEPVIPPS
jgi:hypothetical protein